MFLGCLITSILLLLIPSICAVEGNLAQQTVVSDVDPVFVVPEEKNNQEEPTLFSTFLILLLRVLRRLLKTGTRLLMLLRLFGWIGKGLVLLLLLGGRNDNTTMAV